MISCEESEKVMEAAELVRGEGIRWLPVELVGQVLELLNLVVD